MPIPSSQQEFQGTDRFEVVRKLGSGAAGIVYEVVDRDSGAHVALKTLTDFDPTAVVPLSPPSPGSTALHDVGSALRRIPLVPVVVEAQILTPNDAADEDDDATARPPHLPPLRPAIGPQSQAV